MQRNSREKGHGFAGAPQAKHCKVTLGSNISHATLVFPHSALAQTVVWQSIVMGRAKPLAQQVRGKSRPGKATHIKRTIQ